jgi:hypothetical protein
MTKPGGLLLVLALMLLTGCGSPARVPGRMVLKTAGQAGQSFHADLKIDGVKQEFDAVSPAEYEFQCVQLIGELKKTGGAGVLSFEIRGTNGMCGFGGLDLPGSRISVEYDHDAVGFHLVNFLHSNTN